ncbi:MAG TPA: hypothetical protein VF765_19115 [Polyangiaceae bacterium]
MLLAPLIFAAQTQGAAAAVATGNDGPTVTKLPSAHEYRSGLVVGTSFGGGIGGASGYPNNSQQIGDPAYYSASGLMGGTYQQLWVLGAFSDYISFGFWFGHASLRNTDWRSTGNGIGFRIEAFPLVTLVPPLHNLAVFANLGVGTGNLTSVDPNLPEANGTQSFGGIGVFHEWAFGHVLGGHFAIGPALEFDAIWSQPFEQHGLVASGRFAFYGGP